MDFPLDNFIRNRQLMNVLGAFVVGAVTTMLVEPVGYSLAAGATVAIIMIYRRIRKAKAKANGTKTNG